MKSQKRSKVILILLMLFSSTLSVNYSFAESEENQEEKSKLENSENIRKDRLWTILTEKVVNGKLEVQQYALPSNISEEDMHRELSLDGQTTGWAYVNYKAYHSGIILFDGKASKVGENLWKISSNDILNFRESQFNFESNGESNKVIQESAFDEELNFRIIFTGKLAETNQDVLSLYFTILGLKNTTTVQNLNFLPIGIMSDFSEKVVHSNQGFGNSVFANNHHYFL
ncbi:hypothetical protein [Nitrosopumilus adriaticus]|uniref:Uncharacterized protein n=1 Tax=Nitrosopumilus adriaticus TaxID=1580092 RepID=A0A0D5BZY5_9ARCH|nr:hypothetical protein [Nitrosopumilus adriaticus]AJW69737.1 conserved exported protein of unknown function [Nitrosopumilus adriaticus]